jgi:shikimate dehydrogenase
MPVSRPVLCGSIAISPGGLGGMMQNAAYRELNLAYTYVSFGVEDAPGAVQAVRALGIRGLSVSMPFKVEVMQYLDQVDETAARIGAINTIVNDGGFLTGYNTDWIGAQNALREKVELHGKRAVVVGAGGAARAVVFALLHGGCSVSVINKTDYRGRALAEDFEVEFLGGLEQLDGLDGYDILINTTSVGFKAPQETLIPVRVLQEGKVVMDIVAAPPETRLYQEASARGCLAIPGTRMLLHQAFRQFELYTGLEAPRAVMEAALYQAIGVST